MFAGLWCCKKRCHHDLYNFRLLRHNAPMSTRCRAARECQGNVCQGNQMERARRFHSFPECFRGSSGEFFRPTHLFAFQKCGVEGGRKISDNAKHFGNISEKQPFPEKISDLFFCRRFAASVSPRRSHCGEGGSKRVKVGQSDLVRVRRSHTPPWIYTLIAYYERLT